MMFLDILDNYISEEETIRTIATFIIEGKNDTELIIMGFSKELIERAHLYVVTVYF